MKPAMIVMFTSLIAIAAYCASVSAQSKPACTKEELASPVGNFTNTFKECVRIQQDKYECCKRMIQHAYCTKCALLSVLSKATSLDKQVDDITDRVCNATGMTYPSPSKTNCSALGQISELLTPVIYENDELQPAREITVDVLDSTIT